MRARLLRVWQPEEGQLHAVTRSPEPSQPRSERPRRKRRLKREGLARRGQGSQSLHHDPSRRECRPFRCKARQAGRDRVYELVNSEHVPEHRRRHGGLARAVGPREHHHGRWRPVCCQAFGRWPRPHELRLVIAHAQYRTTIAAAWPPRDPAHTRILHGHLPRGPSGPPRSTAPAGGLR